jgi:hypothetical protein
MLRESPYFLEIVSKTSTLPLSSKICKKLRFYGASGFEKPISARLRRPLSSLIFSRYMKSSRIFFSEARICSGVWLKAFPGFNYNN